MLHISHVSPGFAMQVLDRLSFGKSTVSKSARGLTRVMLFNYWLTYSVLKAKRPKFEHMRAPTSADVAKESDTSAEEGSAAVYNGNGVH